MKSYKNAGELIKDYNTQRSEGGLMGRERDLRIVHCYTEEWVNRPAGQPITCANGQVAYSDGNGGFVINGEIIGYGSQDLTKVWKWKVVADVPSGGFVFEKVYGIFDTEAEAALLLRQSD